MDRFESTITISVRIEDEKILRENGQPLPKLSVPTYGDLVIPSIFLKDVEDKIKFREKEKKKVFTKEKELFFEMNPNYFSNNKNNDAHLINIKKKHFVNVILKEDLYLTARYQKKAKFDPCKCYIPCINKDADSLNHAYTLISQEYESKRRSHTGNVFNNGYYIDKDDFIMLEKKREELFNY